MKNNSPQGRIPAKLVPALCLDLDGTVRYSASGPFINAPEDIRIYPDVESKVWDYRNRGFLIFGISNQGGVAFGLKTVFAINAEIQATIAAFQRNPFHMIKACFHHEDGRLEPFCHRSLLRKPDYGMLAICEQEAFQNGYIVDWDGSLFVGDRLEDWQCAKNARVAFQYAWEFFGRLKPEGEKA